MAKSKYPNFPPVRSPSEEFLRLCREKSDATGVPLSFVQRRALEDWLSGLYDPATNNVISQAEAAKMYKAADPEPHAFEPASDDMMEGLKPSTRKAIKKHTERSIRQKGDGTR